MKIDIKIPTVVERAVERAIIVAAVAGLTYLLGEFDQKTSAGLAGYFAIKTLIDYLNPTIPNNASAAIPVVAVPASK